MNARMFVEVPPRFLAWQMNCFDRGPEELHILTVPNLGELVLNQEELKKIVNEKHPNSGFISTHFAAISRNYKVLRFVIQLGANLNELDCQQQTPLMKALRFKPLDKEALRKQKKCVKILLKAGADAHQKDVHSLTAADYAEKNGIEFFAQLIAKENSMEEHRYSDAPTDFEEIHADVKKKKQVFDKRSGSRDGKKEDQPPTKNDSFHSDYDEENVPYIDTSFEEVDIEEFEKRQSRSTSINTGKNVISLSSFL
jgi:ankyrin repeat protein